MRCIEDEKYIKEENDEITIGINLKKFRIEKNMSQQMLANRLHIKRQTVSSYETGRSIPDIYILIKIADIFHVSIDDLVGRKRQ